MKTIKLIASISILFFLLAACAPAIATQQQTAPPMQEPNRPQQEPYHPQQEPYHPLPTAVPVAQQPRPTGTSVPSSVEIPLPPPTTDNQFQDYGVNPYVSTQYDHLSTFGLDVDTAAYTVARSYINNGELPPYDAVRVEEFVNYFDPGYPESDEVFAIYADGAPSPFTSGETLLRVGIQGYNVSKWDRKPVSLTFVIDKSGSMAEENRIGLVQDALSMLVDQLGSGDSIAIIAFDTRVYSILEPTSARHASVIKNAINRLSAGGTTNLEGGLELGYQTAWSVFDPEKVNRVVLCSDGVANTGETSWNRILDQVDAYVNQGITLTTIGVGMGNFNDVLLEQLSDHGDGIYAYVDTNEEARRVFVDNLTASMQVIARDTKVQVDFNPDAVLEYRLLGYENRQVADEDFRDDNVDAGELGAGHSATAIYAVRLAPEIEGRIATIQLRWEDPDNGQIYEINGNINTWDLSGQFEETNAHYQVAVVAAEFAEILRLSPYIDLTFRELLEYAQMSSRNLPQDEAAAELEDLVRQAARISR